MCIFAISGEVSDVSGAYLVLSKMKLLACFLIVSAAAAFVPPHARQLSHALHQRSVHQDSIIRGACRTHSATSSLSF